MAATFGVRLLSGIESGDVRCDFKGVILGDAWISPVDSVAGWPGYLNQSSLLGDECFGQVSSMVDQVVAAVGGGYF